MADIDNFQTVADGDGLQDGYFNGVTRLLGLGMATYLAGNVTPIVDFNLSSGSVTLTRGKIYRFKSITITGGTINLDATSANNGKALILLSDGDVTFTGGTIDANGHGYTGGGGGTLTYSHGFSGNSFSLTGVSVGGGHGLGGTWTGNVPGASNAMTYLIAADQPDTLNNLMNFFSGTGGGGGGSGSTSGDGGAGSRGGGTIIILAKGNLNFGASATITATGDAGINGSDGGGGSGGGGGGGGSGGMIILGCGGSLTDSGTATLTGGAGGSGGPGGGSADGAPGGSGGSHAGSAGSAGVVGGTNPDNAGGAGGAGGTGIKETFTW